MDDLDEIRARILDLERAITQVNPHMPQYAYLDIRLRRSDWSKAKRDLMDDNHG